MKKKQNRTEERENEKGTLEFKHYPDFNAL